MVDVKIAQEISDVHANLNKFKLDLSRPVKKLKFGVILVSNDAESIEKAKTGQVT